MVIQWPIPGRQVVVVQWEGRVWSTRGVPLEREEVVCVVGGAAGLERMATM